MTVKEARGILLKPVFGNGIHIMAAQALSMLGEMGCDKSFEAIQEDCSECDGSGHECDECDGTGSVTDHGDVESTDIEAIKILHAKWLEKKTKAAA